MCHAVQETWETCFEGLGEVAVCVPLNIFVFRGHEDGSRLRVFSCSQDVRAFGVDSVQCQAVITLPEMYSMRKYDCCLTFIGTVLVMHGELGAHLLAIDMMSPSRRSIVPHSQWMLNLSSSVSGRAFAAQDMYGYVHVFDVAADGVATETLVFYAQKDFTTNFWLSWDARLIAVATNVGLEVRWVADGHVLATIRSARAMACAPLPCGGFAVTTALTDKSSIMIICPCNNFVAKGGDAECTCHQRRRLIGLPQGFLKQVTWAACSLLCIQAVAVDCPTRLPAPPPLDPMPHLQLPEVTYGLVGDDGTRAGIPIVCAATGMTMRMKPMQHEEPVFCLGLAAFRKAWMAACARAMRC